MWQIHPLELEDYLNEILDCDALELHRSEASSGKRDFYIPYMMNDALECYLILKNASMTGTYHQEMKEPVSVDVVDTEKGPALIFHQGTENVFTIWYEDGFCEQKCYRYDQIGHFWVAGEEHWRRLVYIVGTMHDKYAYMGDQVCNEKEMGLIPLMGFAPFRYFSPIHESLDSHYDETANGLECMKALAKEAGDRAFLRLIRWYEVIPFQKAMVRLLVRAMQKPERLNLYELLFRKVEEASLEYPERIYSDGLHKKIEQMRDDVQKTLQEAGFSGTYPLFHKENTQVLAMEEHPFTILESDHYAFKIQYMVSESRKRTRTTCGVNFGFFQKKGNHGWIARDLSFLK